MDEYVNDLRHTAVHEAGHAVIGRVLTLPCAEATIEPDFEEQAAGTSDTGDFWSCEDRWMDRGKCRDTRHAVIARVITLMAGVEAEIELLGDSEGGDGADLMEIDKVDSEFGIDEPRLRKFTKMLVRRHRGLIERTAEALLAEKTLSGPDLDKLVGRSIDDVKPNMTPEQIRQWLFISRGGQ